MVDMITFLTGMATGLSLIVAVGPQNALVIRQGVRREHLGAVLAICIAADALLILAGTVGIGVLVERVPVALVILRWLGVAYLVWFAIGSFRSAARAKGLEAGSGERTLAAVVGTTLALTFLNPAVYLDTVVMLGNLANQNGPDLRWVFAAGAILGSLLWFLVIGYGSKSLAPWLARPAVWRWLDIAIGVVILVIALRLAIGH